MTAKGMVLTDLEYNALNKIASASKLDCWFSIDTVFGVDYVYDIASGKRFSMRRGVSILFSEMVFEPDDPFYGLTGDEVFAFKRLLVKLGIASKKAER